MAEQDTAVSVLTEIIEDTLGGTTDAQTVVPALRDLQAALGTGIGDAVSEYLSEHGVGVAYSVTDGDLSVVLTAESEE